MEEELTVTNEIPSIIRATIAKRCTNSLRFISTLA